MRRYIASFVLGCIVGLLFVLLPKEQPEPDTRIEDSLRSVVHQNDSITMELQKKIDSLYAIDTKKDSIRIITRYETRIKYIDSYRPDQLDSLLAARYKQ